MPRRRTTALAATALTIGGLLWGGIYTYDKGFTKKWRTTLTREFERRGIEAKIGKLTLDPFEGLVARDVRFYQDSSQTRLLATINHIALDIDLAKLVRNENFLNNIDIKNADLSLPLDPDDPSSERLGLSNVSASVSMAGNTIEVSSVTAAAYGINFKLHGTLLKPEPPPADQNDPGTPPDELAPAVPEKRSNPLADALAVIHQHQDAIHKTVNALRSLELPPDVPPTVDIHFVGDIADLPAARVHAELNARHVGYNGAVADSVSAVIEYQQGTTELKRFTITDSKGRFSAFARYAPGDDTVPFNIESTIDLHTLASAFLESPVLGEIVFYESPVLNVEGTIDLGAEPSPHPLTGTPLLPVSAVGNVNTGSFVSRGTVFDTVSFDFSFRPDAYYVRNAVIAHQSGTAKLQALHRAGEDVRWKARVGFHPSVLAPFVRNDSTRKFLARIGTGEESVIRIDAHGSGPSLKLRDNDIHTEVEGHDFTFNGVPVSRLETALHIAGRVYTFDGIHVTRPDGVIAADHVVYDLNRYTVTIENGSSSVDPVASAPLFSSKLATTLSRYPFTSPPTARFSGTVDIRRPAPVGPMPPRGTDLEIEFVAPEGEATYTLDDTAYRFTGARGRIRLLGRDVGMNLAGHIVPGQSFANATFNSGAELNVQGWVQRKAGKPQPDLHFDITTLGPTGYAFLGDELTLATPTGKFHFDGTTLAVDVSSKLAAGTAFRDISFDDDATFSAKGTRDIVARDSELELTVECPGTSHYRFLGKRIPLSDTRAHFDLSGDQVSMHLESRVFDGGAEANATFADVGSGRTPYQAQLEINEASLASLAAVYSPDHRTSGTVSTSFAFSGHLEDPYSLTGEGTGEVQNGNIYAIPVLGPLSPVVRLALTDARAGYSVAREATTTYAVAGGVIDVREFEALTPTFRLTTAGTLDYRNDRVDLTARLNARGAAGILLFPVSKLLEYRGTGPILDTRWQPALTAGPSGNGGDGGGTPKPRNASPPNR